MSTQKIFLPKKRGKNVISSTSRENSDPRIQIFVPIIGNSMRFLRLKPVYFTTSPFSRQTGTPLPGSYVLSMITNCRWEIHVTYYVEIQKFTAALDVTFIKYIYIYNVTVSPGYQLLPTVTHYIMTIYTICLFSGSAVRIPNHKKFQNHNLPQPTTTTTKKRRRPNNEKPTSPLHRSSSSTTTTTCHWVGHSPSGTRFLVVCSAFFDC